MDTSELVSKAAEYTEKFVNAAIPVAKKAYEIGLLTTRIDALNVIIGMVILLLVSVFGWWRLKQHKASCQVPADKWDARYNCTGKDWMDFSGFDPAGWVIIHILVLIPAVISMAQLCQIWLWVKLFAPDLWLAHEAIIKVMEAVAK